MKHRTPPVSTPRRIARATFVCFALLTLAAIVLLPISYLTTRSISLGTTSLVLHRGKLEFATSSAPLTRAGPIWGTPTGARILMGPSAHWRPCRSDAAMTVGSAAGVTLFTITVYYLPLAFVLALATPLASVAWLYARRARFPAGACRHCGYDLSGTPEGVCPECGHARRSSLARTLLRVADRFRPAPA